MAIAPAVRMNAVIDQFAHGKLIEGGRDLRGYTVVARSPSAPDDDSINHIRAQADVGQVYDLSSYAGSDVAFTFGDYVIAGRFRRSPKEDARGYFLQEHYLVLPRSVFPALGNNYAYLLALLPPTIPWRSQYEGLPSLPLPTRLQSEEAQRVGQALNQHGNQVFQALQLALDERPFVVLPLRDAPEQAGAFLETLGLLLPSDCRADLSWAVNVMNVRRCKARIKVISDSTVGTEGHTFVRLGVASPSQPLLPGSDSARSYVNTIRLYRDRFSVSALLKAIETIQVPGDMPWQDLASHLATSLWQDIGPLILEKDLQSFPRPYPQMLYDNMLPMLDQDGYSVSPERRAHFLVAVVAGVLDGVLPAQAASRIRQMAARRLIPAEVNYQVDLFNRAIVGGYKPDSLLLAWVEMAWDPSKALQVAQNVPALSSTLWNDPAGTHSYIIQGLNRAGARQIDQILVKKPPVELDAAAELLLALALMGERLGLPGFRSAQILYTVNRQAGHLAPEGLNRLIDSLDQDVAALTPEATSALALLMLTTGQFARFKQWLAGDWHWMDTLVDWLKASPTLTPTYRSVIGLAIEWFKISPLPSVPSGERHQRLRDVFSCWTGVTRGTLEAINDLTSLLLCDAFKGESGTEAKGPQGLVQKAVAHLPLPGRESSELINRVVDGIGFVRANLFPEGAQTSQGQAEAYRDRLGEAFAAWSRPKLTGKLIKALKNAGLKYEAGWLSHLNVQQRGQEILISISTTLDQAFNLQSTLANLLEETDEITPDQINAILPDPAQRAQLRQLCQWVVEQSPTLTKAISKFQGNIR